MIFDDENIFYRCINNQSFSITEITTLIWYDRQKSDANIYTLSEPINYSDCQFPSQCIQNNVYF